MKVIIISLLSLISITYASAKPNCNVEFLGFEDTLGAKRFNHMIKRNLKKKGYTFKASKDYTYKLQIGEIMICDYEPRGEGLFSKHPSGFEGDFTNLKSGETIYFGDEKYFGFFEEIFSGSFKKMIKKEISVIPHCQK